MSVVKKYKCEFCQRESDTRDTGRWISIDGKLRVLGTEEKVLRLLHSSADTNSIDFCSPYCLNSFVNSDDDIV